MLQIRRLLKSALLLSLAQGSFATDYTVTSVIDADTSDGVCTLREAIYAITNQTERNECAAGGANNRIYLTPGETYQLGDGGGELVLGGATREVVVGKDEFRKDIIEDRPILVSVEILPEPEDVFDDELKENPVISAAPDERLMAVIAGSTLKLTNVTLSGGDVSSGSGGTVTEVGAAAAGLGGLLYVRDSTLTAERRTRFENGVAQEGGAIFLQSSVLSLDDVSVADNSATTGDGGAISTDAGTLHDITIYQTTFSGNTAGGDGGAIHVDGLGAIFVVSNSTFYGNSGGGAGASGSIIDVVVPARSSTLNNVTVAGNDGPGPALLLLDQDPASTGKDEVLNSVLVGNVGGDCGGDAAAVDDAIIDFTLLGDTACPVDERLRPENDGTTGGGDPFPNAATFAHLIGDAGVCPVGAGSANCTPITFDNEQLGFLPNGAAVDPVIINAGPATSSATGACFPSDQRQVSRQDRCDPGAVEFGIASGVEDEFEVITGTTSQPLDVLENDLGDTTVDCTALVPGPLPVAGEAPDSPAVQPCLQIIQAPLRGSVVIDIDVDGKPTLRYRSQAAFQGVDTLVYRVPQNAFVGPTRGNLGVSAPVFLVVEPASGLTELDSIGGSVGGWIVCGLVLLLRRRGGAMAVLLMLSTSLQAATITVNSLDDNVPTIIGDRLCTLREALNNAIDNTPVFSPDCRPGSTGRDLILLPEGEIFIDEPLTVQLSTVEIVGVAPDLTFIDGGGTSRVFDARSLLELRSLTVRNGAATGNGGAILTSSLLVVEDVRFIDNSATDEGGAIYMDFNVNEQIDVSIRDSLFRGNTAGDVGGALSAFGQTQAHDIVIENTTFQGNSATNGGGAARLSFGRGNVLFYNTTFTGNDGGSRGVVDMRDSGSAQAPGPLVAFGNTTFFNNPSNITELPLAEIGNEDPAIERFLRVQIANSIVAQSGTACASPSADPVPMQMHDTFHTIFDVLPTAANFCLGSDSNEATEFVPLGISGALNGGTITPEEIYYVDDIDEGQMYAPHFEITDAAFSDIVDAGSTRDQEDGINNEKSCRARDVKGESRLSGLEPADPPTEGCDLGAYELQVPTAVEDAGNNRRREDRNVVVDVLANDISGPNEIDLTTVIVTQNPAAGSVTSVEVTAVGDDRCVEVNGIEPADRACVLLTYELDAPLTCPQVSPDPFEDTFRYTFEDDSGNVSTEGEVTVSIENLPPVIEPQTIVGKRGENVVFPLTAFDYDGTVLADSFSLSVEPVFAKRGDNGTPLDSSDDVVLGTGILINPGAGTVTYVPADRTKAFADSFTLSVSDDCTSEGSGRFRIVYEDDSTSGGSLLSGGGSVFWGWLVALCAMGLGRRPRRLRHALS